MSHSEGTPHLLHVFPSFGIGGQPIRVATLANHLGRKYRHTIFALDGDLACSSRIEPGIDARCIAMPMPKGGGNLRNILAIRRHLADSKPDILLTYNWGAIEWIAAERWRPVVGRHIHFEDGFGPEETADRQLPRRVIFRRFVLGNGTPVVVPSRTLYWIATATWQLSPRVVLHIPNGIDARFTEQADPALLDRLGDADGRLTVGSIGALRPEKNLARLIRAFAALPTELPTRLVIAGEGPEKPRLAALAASLGIAGRVVLMGAIDRPERLLGYFDVFALSSDTEQMPYSILEAMAAGLPIAATDVGDVGGMLAAENRPYIVAASDEDGFAAALTSLLGNGEERQRLGAANRDRVRGQFTIDNMVAAYDRLFSGAEG
jgi:L-malate glycosyltransferase